jgi:hypothetical protein
MNQEEVLLFNWIKFLSEKHEILNFIGANKISNKIKFFDIIYQENFIFKFFLLHFNIHKYGKSKNIESDLDVDNLNTFEKIQIIKFFLNKNFSEFLFNCENNMKNIFIDNKFNSRDGLLFLWKLIFTVTFMREYSIRGNSNESKIINVSNLEFDSFRKDENDGLHIYNIYNMYKEDNQKIIKNLRKNSLLFKFTIKMVNEVLEKISFDRHNILVAK